MDAEEKNDRIAIVGERFGKERALYGINHADLRGCSFAGDEDGESALKETSDICMSDCAFMLRYPLWHCRGFNMNNCVMGSTCRAAVWYSSCGAVVNSHLGGIKCLRECSDITVRGGSIDSEECGWKCVNMTFEDTSVTSQYFLFGSRNVTFQNSVLKGKYSFQYTENVTVENSRLDTKDAFWHAKNVTVKNCEVRGEYLAWYSENVTFIDCHIIGTQPLCYCKGLKLINCTMDECDLSFEYSEVEADIVGGITSVKNVRSGHVVADEIGEIITEGSVIECKCDIRIRE